MAWMLGLSLPAFFVVFAGLWCGVASLIGRLSGWSKLAERYRCTVKPDCQLMTWQSGKLGWGNYNNCLTLGAAHEGLYLSTQWLFRIGHPPLLIPWSELHYFEQKKLFFKSLVKMQVGEPKIATLTLPQKVIEAKPNT